MTPIDEASLKADKRNVDEFLLPLPELHYGISKHPQLGNLHDRLQVQQYAVGYAVDCLRALLHRSQPVAVVPAEQAEDSAMLDWLGVFIEKAMEVRRKRLAADRDRRAIAAGLVATSRQT